MNIPWSNFSCVVLRDIININKSLGVMGVSVRTHADM